MRIAYDFLQYQKFLGFSPRNFTLFGPKYGENTVGSVVFNSFFIFDHKM